MKHVEIHVDQNVGSGQGYFFEENAPGIDALVELKNESRAVLRLVITRFGLSPVTYDVPPRDELAVQVRNIQTVGVLALPSRSDRGHDRDRERHDGKRREARGRLVIIPNFGNINLV